jgi:hypothetical protein
MNEIRVTLTKSDKPLKNAVRYDASDEDAAVNAVYIKKSGISGKAPDTIKLVVTDGDR